MPSLGEQAGDELRVVHDLVVPAERGVFVAQRVEGVRIAGDDPADAEFGEGRDQRGGELLEEHLVAGAANAFAGRRLARAQDRESSRRRR